MPRRRRQPGLYQTPYGWRAMVSVGGHYYAKRFPADTPVAQMEAWRLATRAAAAVRAAHPRWHLPAEASPYWLRHSVATTLLAASHDLHQTQLYLGHADPRTTMRYVGGAVSTVQRRAAQVLERAMGTVMGGRS